MKGDFSKWDFDGKKNFSGVLHQQGRVLLDTDWNAQTRITNNWQDQAGRDAIGPGVAAIPSSEPNGFKVQSALVDSSNKVKLTVSPGRVWADGLLTYLSGEEHDPDAPVQRTGTYLQPPIQDPLYEESTIDANVRDAVILEVWREAINGFQMPDDLIEPALSGPDTTERLHTAMAFRLLSLEEGDTCENIREKLKDDLSKRGKLKVILQPVTEIDGECPVVEGGGYTGFEHCLYRIEMARVNNGSPPMFKWSQFNGGLVGRGKFDASDKKVTITANMQAIITSGLNEFYLEAVEYNDELGHWEVTCGAEATLNDDNEIELPELGSETFGAIPSSGKAVFFRLWNGIEAVADFPKVTAPTEPNELRDGIRLEFASFAESLPGDYWTFKVRTGDKNPEVLIDEKPPEGIQYHRVPLAILNWDNNNEIDGESIHDCRRIFHPLTDLQGCCTVTVGDGVHSQGDFNDIQEAINHLPDSGGQVCILTGEHKTNSKIEGKKNIVIRGCGEHTVILSEIDEQLRKDPSATLKPAPIFYIVDSVNIKLESMTLMADKGEGIKLEGKLNVPKVKEIDTETGRQIYEKEVDDSTLKWIRIVNNKIIANEASAIDGRGGKEIQIIDNQIYMLDRGENVPGIFLTAEDATVDSNLVTILRDIQPEQNVPGIEETHPGDIEIDPCGYLFYNKRVYYRYTPRFMFIPEAKSTLGGIQIGGMSEAIKIIHNRIIGGRGNGITLGSIATTGDTEFSEQISEGPLYEIHMEENKIQNMGLNGIGVEIYNLNKKEILLTTDHITITKNEILECLQQIPDDISKDKKHHYGGIVIADGEHIVIRDNHIEDNGKTQIHPICGIFIYHGEGIDISGNRILNNGPRDKTDKKGLRGGIVIRFGTVRTDKIEVANVLRDRQDGFPAVKVHNNIVTAPLGQALLIGALGPVSVVGNQFTSQGIVVKDIFPLLAGTVFILNLGISNEFYLQLLRFSRLAKAIPFTGAKAKINNNAYAVSHVSEEPSGDKKGIMANGNVLFSNNQCVLDLVEEGISRSYSSVMIFSLDNIGFHDNQLDTNLLDDIVLSNSILFAPSVLATDNRLKTGFFNEIFSMFSFGFANRTMDNIGTHCFLTLGVLKKRDNTILYDYWVDILFEGGCDALNERLNGILKELLPNIFGGIIHA